MKLWFAALFFMLAWMFSSMGLDFFALCAITLLFVLVLADHLAPNAIPTMAASEESPGKSFSGKAHASGLEHAKLDLAPWNLARNAFSWLLNIAAGLLGFQRKKK